MSTADPTPELSEDAINRALAILLDVGTSIATELKASAPDIHVIDRARAFDIVARAVRQTILLSRHLAERRVATAEATRAQARRTVLRGVEDAIHAAEKPEAAEALRRELLERMERPELDHDLLTRNPAQVINDICRDLGLHRTNGAIIRRTPADVALLCARAAAPTLVDPARTASARAVSALIASPAPRLAEN